MKILEENKYVCGIVGIKKCMTDKLEESLVFKLFSFFLIEFTIKVHVQVLEQLCTTSPPLFACKAAQNCSPVSLETQPASLTTRL